MARSLVRVGDPGYGASVSCFMVMLCRKSGSDGVSRCFNIISCSELVSSWLPRFVMMVGMIIMNCYVFLVGRPELLFDSIS